MGKSMKTVIKPLKPHTTKMETKRLVNMCDTQQKFKRTENLHKIANFPTRLIIKPINANPIA